MCCNDTLNGEDLMGEEAGFIDELRKEISLVNKEDSLSEEIDLHLSSDHEIESELDRNEISLMKEQKIGTLLTNKDNKRIGRWRS